MYLQTAKEKGVPRALLWGLMMYEILRLAVLTRIMAGGTGDGEFPTLIFGAPQALFPLMTLFLLTDFNRHTAYVPLYTAGKVLSVLALSGAAIFWQDKIVQAVLLKGIDFLYLAGGLLVIALGDVFSAICGALLIPRRKTTVQDSAPDTADHGGL
jgi:hypothetical protein